MRKVIILTFAAILCWSFMAFAEEDAAKQTASNDWKDITSKISVKQGDQKGFTEDPEGKVFKDADGNKLKIKTTALGELFIDLVGQKVFKIEQDGKQTELPDAKLKQRNRGMMLVILGDKFRVQATMNEKIPGMDAVPGLTAM